MRLEAAGRALSAGLIVGLSAVVYALAYGALLFGGPLAPFVGYGVTMALISAVIGALAGAFSQERSFIAGPDSNTYSVLSGILATVGASGLAAQTMLNVAVGTILMTSLVGTVSFLLVARPNVSGLVRYVPFPVMAGFLAATGWLMMSGALNVIADTPLSLDGLARLIDHPARPELLVGFAVVAALFALAPRVPGSLLLPGVLIGASLLVDGAILGGLCSGEICSPARWMFGRLQDSAWIAPWQLSLGAGDLMLVATHLPGALIVAFVGILTILLSLASLELSYGAEFDLTRSLRSHGVAAGVTTALGGFMPILSVSRSLLNRQAGGGAFSCVTAAVVCVAMLAGADRVMAYVPRAALGGLILFLGLSMMRQWLWDQRKGLSPVELAEIVLIVALVANFGAVVGFAGGVVVACVIFVMTYSRIPLASLASSLAETGSTVVRPAEDVQTLRLHGGATLIYRLSGYVFFGSAAKIDTVFKAIETTAVERIVVDFTDVSGMDSSAVGVFQRILRRHADMKTEFFLIPSPSTETRLAALAGAQVTRFDSLDRALEAAEEYVLTRHGAAGRLEHSFHFLGSPEERLAFARYCERRTIAPEERLCGEGDTSNEVFFVDTGSLDVVKAAHSAKPVRLAKLQPGSIAGEIAFHTGEARSASIIAAAPSTVHVLTRVRLAEMRAHHPALAQAFDQAVIREMALSLARTSRLVASLS